MSRRAKRLLKRFVFLAMSLAAGFTAAKAFGQPNPVNTVTRPDVLVGNIAVTLCPINGSRVDCSCTNNDAATAIRVGDSNISTTRGQRVTAGATFKATTTGRIFGISEGANATVSCTDQTR